MADAAYERARREILAADPGIPFLDFSRRNLTALPPEIARLKELQFLVLSENQLSTLPPEIVQLTNLQRLNIRHNQLGVLPPEIARLIALQILDLSYNPLSLLPPEITRLTVLQHLDLSHNRLTALPPEIARLIALQVLDLRYNQLRELSPGIARLTALQYLNLNNNQLRALPAKLGALASLEQAAMAVTSLPSEGLFIHGNPLPDPYPRLIAGGQPAATRNVLAYLRGEWVDPGASVTITPGASTASSGTIGPDVIISPPGVSAAVGEASGKGSAFGVGASIAEAVGTTAQSTAVDVTAIEPPPALPAQGVGPHFEINATGMIGFAPPEALDRAGNHIARLRDLHPVLRELARELAAGLGAGNAPHAVLGARARAYADLIDVDDLAEINFRRLYFAGVRLANAARAAEDAIAKGDLPAHDPPEREALDSLLTLLGLFILATAAGNEEIAEEARYQRRPAEERRYRAAANELAQAVQDRPDIVAPAVAADLLAAAQEIGRGSHPERSGVAGRGMVGNFTISLVGGAIGSLLLSASGPILIALGALAGGASILFVSETVKKTKWFQDATQAAAARADGTLDAASEEAARIYLGGLKRQGSLVTQMDAALRRLAGKRKDLAFLPRALDWLKRHGNKTPDEKS